MVKSFSLFILFAGLFVVAFAQNYDESKVPAYTLPDPLTTLSGKKITTSASWTSTRRPEILRLFEDNVYGRLPKQFDSIRFYLQHEDNQAMQGKAHLKQIAITTWNNNKSITINLVLFIPNNVKKPAPTFLLINNRSARNTAPARDTVSEFWPAEMIINNGYAIAAFHVNEASPDNKETYTNGVLQLYPDQINTNHGMKAIGSWAWAASRVMDYFQHDKQIDAKKIALVGHSRGGKAALWAGAQDTRFAMVFSNNSGNSGAALSRRQFGETVKAINTTFPHWFADNYKKYNDDVNALPVDQHMLIALMAPRPVYVTSATKDLWADPKGSFLSLKSAEPVFALYKKRSSLPGIPPPVNIPVNRPPLGYHLRDGAHDLTIYDWRRFAEFANDHFRKK